MIDRQEIMSAATDLELAPEVVEKDYVLGWMLAGIYADSRLAPTWIFKGGTCLKKCYFETYRFSEDLDFTVLDPVQLDAEFLRSVFADISRWILEASGADIPVDLLRFETYQNKRGGTNCEGRLYYRGPLQRSGSLQRVKLDLTTDEKVVLPSRERPVGHPYSDRLEQGMAARCYAFEEVLAEKTRALGERTRPRDLYDVVNLFRAEEHRPSAAVVVDVLRQKCEFKGISVPDLPAITSAEAEIRGDWEAMLAHQLPALPPFESYWEALPAFFSWLWTGTAPPALVAAPLSSGERVFRPAFGQLRALGIGGSHYLEIIRFAAANRLCVELVYQDKSRLIEPYSLRRTSEGNVLLFARRAADGGDRSYRVDAIQGARVTNQSFVPRYAVEFSTTELSIPSLTREASSARPTRMPTTSGLLDRAASVRRSRVVYVYQCSLCKKRFRRQSMDGRLNPHKNPQDWNCPGRTGLLVDTRYR